MNFHEEQTTGKSLLRQQVVSMILVLAVVFCCTAVSAVMWFRQSFDQTQVTMPYLVRVELVKDVTKPFGGDNLLWSSGIFGTKSVDETFTLSLEQDTKAFAVISNLMGNETLVKYELVITQGEESLVDTTGMKSVVFTGTSSVLPQEENGFSLSAEDGQSVRVQLRTVSNDQCIYTASTVEELTQREYPKNAVVYVTNDIQVSGDVVFDQYYPHINLGGHTLSCDSVSITATQDVYHNMTMENGKVQVGGKQYTNQDTISSTGEGNVLLSFVDLQ